MNRIEYIPLGRLAELKDRPDANLFLIKDGKGTFSDYSVIRFSTRKALEAFNIKAGLRPIVYSIVPKGMAVHKHQKEAV